MKTVSFAQSLQSIMDLLKPQNSYNRSGVMSLFPGLEIVSKISAFGGLGLKVI